MAMNLRNFASIFLLLNYYEFFFFFCGGEKGYVIFLCESDQCAFLTVYVCQGLDSQCVDRSMLGPAEFSDPNSWNMVMDGYPHFEFQTNTTILFHSESAVHN